MSRHRPARVADALQQELSQILRHELKDPRLRMVTISRVEVSRDLAHARVWVSVLGEESERREAVEALHGAAGFVRQKLAPTLRLRSLPQLRFVLDRGAEYSQRISDLLEDLNPPGDDQDADPS